MRGAFQAALACLTVVALGAAVPSPAAAQSDWTGAQELSAVGQDGELPQVVIADDGSAVAVWRRSDGCKVRLQAAYRSRGGNFSAPEFIQLPAVDSCDTTVGEPGQFQLKGNRRGDAIVVFERGGAGGITTIRSQFKAAGGKFQVASDQTVGSSSVALADPQVGIDANGTATAIWHGTPTGFNSSPSDSRSIYTSATRPRAGAWTNNGNILGHDFGTEVQPVRHNETDGSIAVDEAGNRMAVLTTQRFDVSSGTFNRQTVHAAMKLGSATTWTDQVTYDNSPGPDNAADATEAAYGARGGLVAWRENVSILASHRGAAAAVNINAASQPGRPTFGLDATGNALGMWTQGGRLAGAFSQSTGSGPFEATDSNPVPGNAPTTSPRTDPNLSTGPSDTAAVVFEETCGPQPSPSCPKKSDSDPTPPSDDQTVRAAIRPPGAKTQFGAPATLSAPVDLEVDGGGKRETGPKVVTNANGEGVATWSRRKSGNLIVEAALLVPRGATPAGVIPVPPPPPPPPPPDPSAIVFARDPERGEAAVLTAKVDGPVSAIQWKFGTKNEPDIVVRAGANGQVPRSIRVRPENRSFTAVLTAFGPGGQRSFKRSLTMPKDPNTPEARKVLAGVEKSNAAPVFATGDAAGLLGTKAAGARASRRKRGPVARKSAACSPIEIWSGKQKVDGCFKPIEKIADIPAREKGAVKALATELRLDETKKELMDQATQLTDSYVSEGKAVLNDKFPVTPSQAASIVSMPQAETLISAKAELPVGGASYDPKNGFNLKLDPKKLSIPLGKLPKPPKLPRLGGLEIVGDWNVDLEKQEAKIKASVKLPDAIKKAGVSIQNEVTLRATPERVIVDGVKVGPIDVNIGALAVQQFKIEYIRESDEWLGQAKACIIKATCFDMVPPNGSIRIKGGRVVFAGASLIFPPPGVPLFTGINLEKVGFGIGFDPTRMVGSARIAAAKVVAIEGRLVLAFPSAQTPLVLRREEVGPDFPANMYGQQFTRPTVGVTGGAAIKIPELGDIKVARGHVLYEYPGYVNFGAGFDLNLLEITQLRGALSGELDMGKELFNLHGDIEACLFNEVCGKAVANISRGPNKAGGAGACIGVLGVNVGGGVQWARLSEPFIWPFDGCKWSRFKLDVRSARAQAAAGGFTMNVRRGEPSPALKLYGQGGAPTVKVTGPGGQALSSVSPKGVDVSGGGKIRILRFDGNKQAGPFTVVGLQDAQPGRYTVEALPGSAPVTRTARATDPPAAKITGKVSGKDRRRVLTYEVRRRAGQKVTFQEVAPGGAAKTLGTTRGGRGKLRFTPAPGGRRRQIVAQFELEGIPAERKVVTSFRPPSAVLGRPAKLALKRGKGSKLRASWKRVRGAATYEIAATLSSRRVVFARTSRRSVSLKGVPRYLSGRVTVRAIADMRQGRTAGRRFKAVERRPTAFRSFPRCKVAKRKISCGGKSKAKTKAKKRSSAKRKR